MSVRKELNNISWRFSTRNLSVELEHRPYRGDDSWSGTVATRIDVDAPGHGSREEFLYSLHQTLTALYSECAEMMGAVMEEIEGGETHASEDPQSKGWTPSVYSQGSEGQEDLPDKG